MRSIEPVFTVKSVADAISWYRETLGFEPVFVNDPQGSQNYAVLRNGSATLQLGLEQDMANVAGQGGCSILTAEFESVLANVRRLGIPFYVEPSRIPTGQRTFGIRDPDGNLIAFVEALDSDVG